MLCVAVAKHTRIVKHKNIIWNIVCTQAHAISFSCTRWVAMHNNKPNGISVRYQQWWHHRWLVHVASLFKFIWMKMWIYVLCLWLAGWLVGCMCVCVRWWVALLLLNLYKWMAAQNSTKTLLIVAETSMRSTFKLKRFSTRASKRWANGMGED